MTEHSNERITEAIMQFDSDSYRQLIPPGVDAARTTVRRRRIRVSLLGVATAVLIIVSVSATIVGLNTTRSTGQPGTPVESATGTPTRSDPSVSATGTPGSAGPVAPSRAITQGCRDTAPIGGLSPAQLCDATLDLPPWRSIAGLPYGEVDFSDGKHVYPVSSQVRTAVVTPLHSLDANGDNRPDIVARVEMIAGEAGVSQIVVFSAEPGGGFRTVGQVVAQELTDEQRQSTKIARIGEVTVTGGQIRVRVADTVMTSVQSERLPVWQWRTYSYADGLFSQVGGFTSFAVANGLMLESVSPVTLGAMDADGCRTATISFVVRNPAPATVTNVAAVLRLVEMCDTGAVAPATVRARCLYQQVGSLAAGSRTTVTIRFAISDAVVAQGFVAPWDFLQIRGGTDTDGDRKHAEVTPTLQAS